MRVSQILCAAGPVDAVTNQGLAYRALFDSWGWDGSDYAAVLAPGMGRHGIRHLHELRPAKGETLVLHYSGFARGVEELFTAHRRTLLVFHNITPAQYFWAHEPVEAVRCELARAQLATLAGRATAVAGVSEFNAGELRTISFRDTEVIPVLFDRDRLGPPGQGDPPPGPPTVLFVGRLVPHKRQDLVIRAFARLRHRQHEAKLILVGVPLSREFLEQLRQLADEHAPGSVEFLSGISSEQLADQYRRAHAFLCMSEHEGFCIPLLESFHFGVPVVARAAGAVSEVVGDAGVLVGDEDGLDTVAEVLRIAIADGELRAELRERAARRLEVYDRRAIAERLHQTLTAIGSA
jgi:glycosyltransferase involved in cell wall biosynthesis